MNSGPIRVLMVDDEEDLELLIRQKFRRRIRKGEFEFLFARNGKEALQKLEENPDLRLVLSDINMPVMDGLTLLDKLNQVNPDVRAVVVSAYGDMENIRAAMNRGAFDFLTKPIDFNDLVITIEKTQKYIEASQRALENRDRLVSLKQELEVAKQVQMASLPTELPAGDDFDIYAVMHPAREIGGDFYDFFHIDEHRVGLVIADVSDKGVPAALITLVTQALLKSAARTCDSPSGCLHDVNEFLSEDNDACMFVTLFYCVVDFRDGRVRYCNGGHNLPRLLRSDGVVEVVPLTRDPALGVLPGHTFSEGEVIMGAGDTLFLYTDGITEAQSVEAEEFGDGRLDELLGSFGQTSVKDIVQAAVAEVERFANGAPQSDDMTCLCLRRKSLQGA